jgi:hypothetical protein
VQCIALCRDQSICPVEDGTQELVQPGVGQLRLRLDSRRSQDREPPTPGGALSTPQQRRLADPRLSGQDQDTAEPVPIDQRTFDGVDLAPATDELRGASLAALREPHRRVRPPA